jgi:uncharacterized protein YccT (UPF0319 family)
MRYCLRWRSPKQLHQNGLVLTRKVQCSRKSFSSSVVESDEEIDFLAISGKPSAGKVQVDRDETEDGGKHRYQALVWLGGNP